VLSLVLGVFAVELISDANWSNSLNLIAGNSSPGWLLAGLVMAECSTAWLVALPIALSLEAFRMLGRFVDAARGAQVGEQLDAQLGEQLSMLERFAAFGIVCWIFSSGSYQLILNPILLLNKSLGPAILWHEAFTRFDWINLMPKLIDFSAQAIAWAFMIAAPVLLLALFLDLTLLVMMKALGRIHFSFELLPLKLIVGVLLIAGTLYLHWPLPTEIIAKSSERSAALSRNLLANDADPGQR
jgi:flagellar biosynthesis protein FliR